MRNLNPKDDSDLHDIETLVHAEDTIIARLAQALVVEVRRLKHELNDPNYMFAGGRIPRAALICRTTEIDKLRKELKAHEHPKD